MLAEQGQRVAGPAEGAVQHDRTRAVQGGAKQGQHPVGQDRLVPGARGAHGTPFCH
jgi:hypothetical protein